MDGKKTLMLIDDEVDITDMLKFQLMSSGFDVVTACDGVDALGQLQVKKPHLIILDMNMPRMGGIEFYKRICGPDGKPQYPVFILTARANLEHLFKEFSVDGFMSKPFDVDHLIREVQLILKKRYILGDASPKKDISRAKSVFVVENDFTAFAGIAATFLGAGYMLGSANTGTNGIEKIMLDVPDCALIKMGLPDLSGDLIISRLKGMAKTKDVLFLLYSAGKGKLDEGVRKQISQRCGLDDIFEYNEPQELMKLVESRWYQIHQ